MTSKELLSEVLKDNDILHFDFSEGDTILYYANDQIQQFLDTPYHKINIYELAHKCKEWAFKQGYELFSRILSNDNQPFGNCVVYRVEADPEESLHIVNDNTEHEAIFKACEWILKEMR